LYYSLFALALEQLFRVSESAVLHKCKALKAPKSINTFEKRIDWLVKTSVIHHSRQWRWDGIRQLRNSASHPKFQSIHLPGEAIQIVQNIAEDINSLWPLSNKL
tara:strand:- start:42256 stop:42567 length:312 start_codon:yes stop_codon:yes gene_type:complete